MKNKYESWSDEDLEKEYKLIDDVLCERRKNSRVTEQKNLCINGITVKDIAVRHDDFSNDYVYFSFFIKHDGKLYNIYYDLGTYDKNHKFSFHPWWPIVGEEGDQWDRNGAREFIPDSFREASENCYEYDGTFEEAIEQLKKHGITDINKGDW